MQTILNQLFFFELVHSSDVIYLYRGSRSHFRYLFLILKFSKKSILGSWWTVPASNKYFLFWLISVSAYFKRQPIFVSFAVTIFIQVIGTWLITFAYRYISGFFTNLSGEEMSLVYYGINCLLSLLTTIQFWGIYLTRFTFSNFSR
jgi:hypothetical protein